jgi:DNA-binding beta-propeller fold protein YncE
MTEIGLKRLSLAAVLCWISALTIAAAAQPILPAAPLVLETTIALSNVSGRIDHLTLDKARNRLFVAEVGNGTVDVIDLTSGKLIHRIASLDEPQGIAYVPSTDLLVVACGGDGTVRIYSGGDFSPHGSVVLGSDADNVRVDPRNGLVIVGYGSGGLAIIDPQKSAKIADISLSEHPEAFQLAPTQDRVFVNVPDAHEIAVAEFATAKVVAHWKPRGLASNFPMALDEIGNAAVVFRSPTRLGLFETATGGLITAAETCGDADDIFFDAKRSRFYVSCGQGVIDVFQKDGLALRRLARIETSSGARTSLFVPELDRLFVAVRAGLFGSTAEIRAYRPAP